MPRRAGGGLPAGAFHLVADALDGAADGDDARKGHRPEASPKSSRVPLPHETTEEERFRAPLSPAGPGRSRVGVPTSGSVLCPLGPQRGPDRVEVDEDGGPNGLER